MVGHHRHGGAGGQRPGGVFMGGHGEGREGGSPSGQLLEEGCSQPQREEEDGGGAARRAQAALRHGAVVVGGTAARLVLRLDEGLEEKRGQSGMAQHLGGEIPAWDPSGGAPVPDRTRGLLSAQPHTDQSASGLSLCMKQDMHEEAQTRSPKQALTTPLPHF